MKYDFAVERAAYNVLKSVFNNRAYSSIELDRILDSSPETARGKITALVYGVLEKSIQLDYVIDVLVNKKVKSNIEVLLKMGLYELRYGSEPEYAVVSRYVSFARDRFNGIQSFINAVLRKSKEVVIDESRDDAYSLSVRFSQPLWLVESLIDELGKDRTVSILACDNIKATHIRRNANRIEADEFDRLIEKMSENHRVSRTKYGYYVTRSIMRKLKPDIFTAQSLASMYTVNIYAEGHIGTSPKILDLCAAPGGKSIYMKELIPNADITACDLHFHRVQLIKSYAARLGTNLEIEVNDASELKEEWIDKFDIVICDVPCSGSGLLVSSPDILLFKSESDVSSLGMLQSTIISTAAHYVKVGGELEYSTCSIFTHENERVVRSFLAENDNFEIVPSALGIGTAVDGMIRLYPDADGCDGFFIAKLRRVK